MRRSSTGNLTGRRPTILSARLTGHAHPRQRTDARAPFGAETESRVMRVPNGVTLPTSLTIGNGLKRLGGGVDALRGFGNGTGPVEG